MTMTRRPYAATGEHAHNRMVFKQLLQANAIDVCQIDSCRLAGIPEILAVLLMAAKFGVPVCPHAGGVGLCEYVIHRASLSPSRSRGLIRLAESVSLIDYLCVSGTMETNVLEYVDHLHDKFRYPCTLNSEGRYNVRLFIHLSFSQEETEAGSRRYRQTPEKGTRSSSRRKQESNTSFRMARTGRVTKQNEHMALHEAAANTERLTLKAARVQRRCWELMFSRCENDSTYRDRVF
jgi:hypothetical protein